MEGLGNCNMAYHSGSGAGYEGHDDDFNARNYSALEIETDMGYQANQMYQNDKDSSFSQLYQKNEDDEHKKEKAKDDEKKAGEQHGEQAKKYDSHEAKGDDSSEEKSPFTESNGEFVFSQGNSGKKVTKETIEDAITKAIEKARGSSDE